MLLDQVLRGASARLIDQSIEQSIDPVQLMDQVHSID
jgi:hypothetical protein